MNLNRIKTIAKKEFFDSVKSRSFAIVFGIFLVLMLTSSISGVNQYNEDLQSYQETMASFESMKDSVLFLSFPEPDLISVLFGNIVSNIAVMGAILAIMLGYNAISGEKERGNLKLLLSYPLYRDDVINGKFLGKIAVLVMTLIITALISVSVALIMGLVPTGDDIIKLMLFMAVSIVYLVTFLGISIFFSTVSKNETSSMLNSFMFWIVSAILITSVSGLVADAMVSDGQGSNSVSFVVSGDAGSGVDMSDFEDASQEVGMDFFDSYEKKWKVQNMIEAFISPSLNYEQVANAVLGNSKEKFSLMSDDPTQDLSVFDILMGKMTNLVSMFLWAIISLIATYYVFMRQDIR
ncbi:ABC transporter permease [Methanococcoides orientis]|uniref:ABC transporter permease subunit n=1 Tax=Methanococcoides orientis TaxID=2822137 RepID=UPI001E2E6EF0|nr:ABC transporter permease subunit [Methanococcoides orientis]UGV41204.1 ABC transporter permease [Methanococcoides orientis]